MILLLPNEKVPEKFHTIFSSIGHEAAIDKSKCWIFYPDHFYLHSKNASRLKIVSKRKSPDAFCLARDFLSPFFISSPDTAVNRWAHFTKRKFDNYNATSKLTTSDFLLIFISMKISNIS